MIATDHIVRHRFVAMGSIAEVVVVGKRPDALAQWARETIEQLEAKWSRFRPDSELNHICRLAGHGPVTASRETIVAIGNALALWFVTDGRFDMTIRSALEACGYDRTFPDIACDGPETRAPADVPGCAGIAVDRDRGTVILPAAVCIDLGGIGKGLAADLAATGAVARGARGICVALGGDVRVAGEPFAGRAWPIPIEDPFDETRTLCERTLVDGAVVTSTTRFRRWRRGGVEMHHLIDPTTRAPARAGVSAVIVQADDAWWAEGIAKAALVAGVDDGLELLERLGLAAIVVTDDRSRRYTSYWDHA